MRLNLSKLEDRIAGLMIDLDNLDRDRPKGYRKEIKAIEAEIAEIKGVHARGIQFGTGYYDYVPVKKTNGRKAVLFVAALLLAALFIVYFIVVL